LPTRLQYYCNTIAQYSTPLRPAVLMQYTIHYCAWQYRVKANLGTSHPLNGPDTSYLNSRYASCRVCDLFFFLQVRYLSELGRTIPEAALELCVLLGF